MSDNSTTKKCQLVPFKGSSRKYDDVGKFKAIDDESILSNNGCCPGQTPHHLLPNAQFQTKRSGDHATDQNIEGCKDEGLFDINAYTTAGAPNMCVEGTDQHSGSHGKIHKQSVDEFEEYLLDGSITYTESKKAALTAHNDVFTSPKCSKPCLDQQLDAYYHKACHKGLKTLNPAVSDFDLRKSNGSNRKEY